MSEILSRRQFLEYSRNSGVKVLMPEIPIPKLLLYPLIPETTQDSFESYLWYVAKENLPTEGKEVYNTPLAAGVGFATTHTQTEEVLLYQGKKLRSYMEAYGVDYTQLTDRQRNIFDITSNGINSIKNSFIVPGRIDLEESLSTDKNVGLIATRSPEGIGTKYLAFAVSSPSSLVRFIYYLGPVLAVDCPDHTDWDDNFSQWTYSYKGWKKLPWIAEVSPSIIKALPKGLSNDPNNLDEGRPGLILVNLYIYESYLHSQQQVKR